MSALLELLTKLPAIFQIIHSVVLIVEAAFPKASGAQKLDAAVSTVATALPDIVTAANSAGVITIVNLLVSLLNKPGGTFANAKQSDTPSA